MLERFQSGEPSETPTSQTADAPAPSEPPASDTTPATADGPDTDESPESTGPTEDRTQAATDAGEDTGASDATVAPPRSTQTASTDPAPISRPSVSPGTDYDPEDIEGAMERSIDVLRQTNHKYSLSFMVACRKETVTKLLGQYSEVLVFTRRLKGRDEPCFMLTWGHYETREEARTDIANIPSELSSSSDPAWIANVGNYVR